MSDYHHGDLPATLVRTALAMLDADPDADLSLRAVARAADVSPAAPYRHFPTRQALLSAVAAIGYRELTAALVARHTEPESVDELADLAVTYVDFALTRAGLFRVMFTEGCDRTSEARVAAVAAIHAYLSAAVSRALAPSEPEALATGAWALVHGLALLHLDGKLTAESPADRERHVRATVLAVLVAPPHEA